MSSTYYCEDCKKFTSQDCGKHGSLLWPLAGISNPPAPPIYYPPQSLIPHKCPVCNGTALVSFPPGVAGDSNFTSTSSGPWTCPACEKGIIWK